MAKRNSPQSAEAPSRADDAASVAAFLRHEGRLSGAELAIKMTWPRRRVDRACGALLDDKRVTLDAGDRKYSLLESHVGNLSS